MKQLFILLFTFATSLTYAGHFPVGVTRLNGSQPGLPDQDLEVIHPLIQDAQIVAIGESAHGSREYTQLRHRIVQHLIESKGFQTIFWEHPTFKTMKLNAYVTGKSDDRAGVIASLHELEKNQEQMNFFDWIREWNKNQAPQNQITLRGFDIWDNPWEVKDILVHVFRLETDISARMHLKNARANCFGYQYNDWDTFMKSDEYKSWVANKKFEDDRYFACQTAVVALNAHILKNRERMERTLGKAAVIQTQMALHLQYGYEQDLHFLMRDFRQAETARDHAQARIFELERQLDGYDRKAVLLAHNLHISKAQSKVSLQGWDRIPSMGEHLVRRLKGAYKAFAISGYDIANFKNQYPKPTSPHSLDLKVKDFGVAFVNTAAQWIASKSWFIHLEEIQNGERLNVSENFDGLFSVPQSTAPSPVQ